MRRKKLSESYIQEGTQFLQDFVASHDLVVTAGGDFHGDSGILGGLMMDEEYLVRVLSHLGLQ